MYKSPRRVPQRKLPAWLSDVCISFESLDYNQPTLNIFKCITRPAVYSEKQLYINL